MIRGTLHAISIYADYNKGESQMFNYERSLRLVSTLRLYRYAGIKQTKLYDAQSK